MSEPPSDPTPEPPQVAPTPLPTAGVDRRGFLGVATLCVGACAGAMGVVGAAIVGTPLAKSGGGQAGWFDLGPLDRFADGEVTKVAVRGEVRDAFRRFADRSRGRVLVLRKGESVNAFSARCPHNGCDVYVTTEELVCPCHDSHFAFDGALKTGESPRGLDPLEAKVEGERVLVHYQRFALGTPERKPV